MRGRQRGGLAVHQGVVVPPEIGGPHIASEIELIQRAVNRIAAAPGHHLDLAAGRAVEIGRLARGADLELFDALDRRRHHSRGRTARRRGAAISVADRVRRVGARHVVAIAAAIELERVLIGGRSGHIAVQGHAHLKHGERRGIAAQVRQQL